MIMNRVFIIFLFLTNIFAYEVTNGRTFLLEVEKNSQVLKGKTELNLLRHPTKKDSYFVLLPISYKTKDKEIKLLHVNQNKKEKILLHVNKGDYKKETLTVNPKKVKPPKSEENRIYKEYLESKKIYATITKKKILG